MDRQPGQTVVVRDGQFAGLIGRVLNVVATGRLPRVVLYLFGKAVPVEVQSWQVAPDDVPHLENTLE